MIEDLVLRSEEFDQSKADYTARSVTFHWDKEARIVPADCLGMQSQPLTMTDNALSQVCSKLGPVVFGRGSQKSLPFDYLKAVEPALRSEILNTHIEKDDGSWKVRAYGDTARAVVSGGYPGGQTPEGFENTVYLRALNDLAAQSEAAKSDFHAIRPVVTPDDIYTRFAWKTIQDPKDPKQTWGLGGMLANNEVGRGCGKVFAGIKRGSCDNTFYLDTREIPGVELVHRGSYAAMRARMKEAIGVVLRLSAKILDAVWEAEETQIPDIDDVLAGLALQYKWNDQTKIAVARGTEGGQTRMAIINGMTLASHTAIEDPADQLVMELFAGSLLFEPVRTFEKLAAKSKQHRAGLELL